ncbi:hypothetical protein [Bacillus infantis]|uniref:hypothetical protein n=1 Tax=Bacillus infantis TaxID=324767 RepID=UPI0013ED13CF|nr:hypothetical protein [Bacillus infantis]
MLKTSEERILEEIKHNEILKSDEKSLKAKEFLNILTEMVLIYSQSTNEAGKTA